MFSLKVQWIVVQQKAITLKLWWSEATHLVKDLSQWLIYKLKSDHAIFLMMWINFFEVVSHADNF